MTRLRALSCVAFLAISLARGGEPPPGDVPASAEELELIRSQLVALEIEKALAAVNAILERPGLAEATRAAALDLRAQAHVASDDIDAAEKDYRAILELNPGYEPGREVTSKKAMSRFAKLHATMIGTVRLDVDPKDAELTLDERPLVATAGGAFPAVAGERRLKLARKGFDAQDVAVRVVAGEETLVKIRLVPNARTFVVRTDVDGVAVTLDGTAAGMTARASDQGSEPGDHASLVIEDVAIGEHEVRLAKPCYATEVLEEVVTVDLADRSAKMTRVVAMREARTRVTATGANYEGELRIDRERVASLPLTAFTMCPGPRTIEVVASGRVVWSAALDTEESDLTLDLAPRPSAVVVGGAWPATWAATLTAWSLLERVEAPAGADLTRREGWSAVPLPEGTDLAVGVMPGGGVAGADGVVLYGPMLREVEEGASRSSASRPSFSQASLDVVLVDAGPGSVVVAAVSPEGAAASAGLRPGDRLVAISGGAVKTVASARETIAAAGIGTTLELDVASPTGTVRKVEATTSGVPALAPPRGRPYSRVVLAAWASAVAAAGGPDAPLALASLAVSLERSGRTDAAQDIWRRVRATGGAALQARAAYAVGAGFQSAGKTAEAIDMFRESKSAALARGDAALAAAAADRLADLGVSSR